ncbi:HAD family phosphatase [Arthrobacter sp. Br18]|uniref:HAD family hydrolase n=1 Tax=Arthrobacter sp. Br18 TaxID=1312954 RepID=UPI00047ED989|nr:HAD family phosphatase [Arthrobacter sp. Br18]
MPTDVPSSTAAGISSADTPHDGGVLQAVLWDMDGTIVDTEPYWIAAELELVERHHGIWSTAQAEQLVGQALEFSAGLLQEAGVDLSVREIIDHLISEVAEQVRAEVPWRPGARELLEELRSRGVPCVMVTMSERLLAAEVASHLPAGTFAELVTGDMVARGKPDPEAYQQAFDFLEHRIPGLAKSRVVAIEDSLPGVTAALAAGVVTVAVPHFVPLPHDPRSCHWPTLQGRTVSDLEALLDPTVVAAGASR